MRFDDLFVQNPFSWSSAPPYCLVWGWRVGCNPSLSLVIFACFGFDLLLCFLFYPVCFPLLLHLGGVGLFVSCSHIKPFFIMECLFIGHFCGYWCVIGHEKITRFLACWHLRFYLPETLRGLCCYLNL